jgi:autotransporter translocation and assembly factor TamB
MKHSRAAVAARRVLLVAVALLLAFVAAALLATQIPAVRAYVLHSIESRLTHYAGREIRVERAGFRPLQGELELNNVRVAGGSDPASGTLLAVDSIRLSWDWRALLDRSLRLQQLLLVRPRLTLRHTETSAAPSAEWLARLLDTRTAPLDGWTLDVPRLELQAGTVTWDSSGTTGSLQGVNGVVERRDRGGAASFGVTLRASRLLAPLGGRLRDAAELALEMDGTPQDLAVTRMEGVLAGIQVTGKGRVLDPTGAGQLDLELAVSSPLTALLKRAGVAKEVDGVLQADGHLRGPWARAVFRGKVRLQLPKASRARDPMVFDLSWTDGRLEVETPETAQPDAFRVKLLLEPATGAYGARLRVRDADLGKLTDLPAVLAQLVGFTLPEDLAGRLTADVDLVGRGTDLATLRGFGTLRVDDLSVEAGLPTGRAVTRVRATASRLSIETFTLDVPGGTVQGEGSVVFADGQVNVPVRADIRSMAALGRGFGLPGLGGAATLRGRLTGTRQAPRFQGHLAWREPQVAVYAADRIDGDVEWAPRTLRSPRLVARLGQTVVTVQGSVVAQGLAPLPTLDPKRDLALDLTAQVSPGRTVDLAPFLPAQLPVRGAFRAGGRIAGTPQEPTGELEVAFTSVQTWDEQWQRGSALLRLTPGAVEIPRLSLQRGGEQLTGSLHIGRDGALTGNVSTTTMDLAKIRALSGSQVGGRAGFVLDVQGTLQEVRILGKAAADALRFRNISFGPGVATFAFDRKALDLDLTLSEGGQRLRLALGPPPDRGLKLDLALSNADLAPLLRAAGIEALRTSQAHGTGRVLMNGPAAAFANAAGEATFDALRLRWQGETWENRGPVEVAWQGRAATLRRVRLRSRNGELDVHGTLTGGDESNLQVRANFPLTAIASRLPHFQLAGGSGTADLQVRGSLAAPEVRGTLQVKDGRTTLTGVPAPIEDVQGAIELEGERAFIRSLQGRIAGGSVRATGEIAWHGEEWSFRTDFQEEGGRAEELLGGLYDGKSEVTGTLSLGGTLTSRGRGAEGFRSNLGGNLKLAMLDGQLGRQTFTVRALSLLNLEDLLDVKSLGMSSQGMPYRRLTGDIAIDRGVARTENLLLESRAFNVSAHGHVDLPNETIDMNVAVKPFQTLDRVVTKTPLVGWLLSGKDGAVVAAFYRVSGPLDNPTVASLPAKSLGRNVFGIFQRLLQLPEEVTGTR